LLYGKACVHAWAASQNEGRLVLGEYEKGLHNLPIASSARPRIEAALVVLEGRFAGRLLPVSNAGVGAGVRSATPR